ncbi:hypothetical protein OEZ86_013431 [Tetradesmus obliquus]|nr:hypothetical protein OEZ86_013431 [Tetradesmus obliquus]
MVAFRGTTSCHEAVKDADQAQAAQQQAAQQETPVMQKVKGILQDLLLSGAEGPEACDEAAKVLLGALKTAAADSVSLTACGSQPGVALLVAAQGAAASALLQQQLVLRGGSTSAGWFTVQRTLPQALYRTAATDAEAEALPEDWKLFYHEGGLRTFMAVPVTGQDGLLGVVGLASKRHGAFMEYWWQLLLSIVCTGLVRMLRSPIMSQLVELLLRLQDTRSSAAFITALLQAAGPLLSSYTNLTLGVRLGLLSPDSQHILLLHARHSSSGSNATRVRQPVYAEGQPQRGSISGGSTMAAAAAAAEDELTLLRINAGNTLLLDALERHAPRTVRNTVSYLEGVSEPAHDVFVEDEDIVSSIVVVPLLVDSRQFGGLYVTHEQPWSEGPGFSKAKELLVGLGGLLQRQLAQHEAGQPGAAWTDLLERKSKRRDSKLEPSTPRAASIGPIAPSGDSWRAGSINSAASGPLSGSAAAAAARAGSGVASPTSDTPAAAAAAAAAASASPYDLAPTGSCSSAAVAVGLQRPEHAGAATPAALLKQGSGVPSHGSGVSAGSSRQPGPSVGAIREAMTTSSMVEMLRQQVQRSKDRVRDKENRDAGFIEDLELHRLIGRGGFGSVFSGNWKGSAAAIKVMYVQMHERQLMKNAMEMAVLTTIRHLNVVRVYAVYTDMVEEAVPGGPPGPDNVKRRFRPAWDGSIPLVTGCSSLCNIVVMEVCDKGNLRQAMWLLNMTHILAVLLLLRQVCDKGNLRQAMRRGLLHKRTANKGLVVDMRLLVTVLLEVARSIQYLHGMNIIHCDVKAENVLLKTNPSSPTGFDCKLGDFGLVKLLLGKYYITNRSGSGTVTHLAPELFEAGSKVTPAVDAYAFGIMCWELYSCQRLYAGMVPEAIVNKVVHEQGRPQFPRGTPPAYQQLAEACWAQGKHQRPEFDEVVRQLQALLDASGGPFTFSSSSSSSAASISNSGTNNAGSSSSRGALVGDVRQPKDDARAPRR